MARSVSLSFQAAMQAQHVGDVPVLLVKITHPSLAEPVYLSSDPTERLSAEPLAYGTVSNKIAHAFVLMGATLPDDQDRSPPKTTLVFENVDRDMAGLLRSITSPAKVDLSAVMASSPDQVEARFTKLRATRGSYDASQVSLDISREPWTSEPMPAGRMSKQRFPGLF